LSEQTTTASAAPGTVALDKTFTVSTAQNYLIMGSCGLGHTSATLTYYTVGYLDHTYSGTTTVLGEMRFYERDNLAERAAFVAMRRMYLEAGSHTMRIMYYRLSGSSAVCDNPTLLAIPLEGVGIKEFSAKSNVVETCTAAAVPYMDNSVDTFFDQESYFIMVEVDNASGAPWNPAGTVIELFVAPDSGGAPGSWASEGTSNTDYRWKVQGLTANKSYWFKARAQNWRGCWTDYCDVTTWATVGGPPQNFRCADCSSTTITWAWDDMPSADGFQVYDNDTEAVMVPEIASGSTSTEETGLLPNTTYRRFLRAYDLEFITYYYNDTQSVVNSTSAATWTNTCVIELVPEYGTYLAIATAQISRSSTGYNSECRLFYNQTDEINYVLLDNYQNYYYSFMGSKVFSADGVASHSFAIQLKGGAASWPSRAQNSALILIKLRTDEYVYAEDENAYSSTSSTPELRLEMTISPPSLSDYLVVFSSTHNSSSTAAESRSDLQISGSSGVISKSWHEPDGTNEKFIHGGFWPVAGISTDTTVGHYSYRESGTSWKQYMHIAAIRLSDPIWTGYGCNTYPGQRSTGSTATDAVVLTFTPPEAGNYLIMASGQVGTSVASTAGRIEAWIDLDGTLLDRMVYYSYELDIKDRATFAAIRLVNLSASSHTAKIRFGEFSTGTTYIGNSTIIALPLEYGVKIFTGKSNVVETCTAATMPFMDNTTDTFPDRGIDFIGVQVNSVDNPASTLIELWYAPDSGGAPGAWTSLGNNNTDYSWTAPNLDCGSQYWFKSRAFNWRGCPTAYCDVATWWTLPEIPLNLRDDDCSSTSITWAWENILGESGFQIYDNDTDAVTVGDIPADVLTTEETGLEINKTYRRYLKAYTNDPVKYYYTENLGEISTTSNSIWSNVCTLEMSPPNAGDYMVIAAMQAKSDSSLGREGEFRLIRDETDVINYGLEETDNFFHSFMGSEVLSASGSDTYKYQLQIKSTDNGYWTRAQNAAIIAILIPSPNYAGIDNLTEHSINSNSWTLHTDLTVTPYGSSDDYWLVHSSNYRLSTTSDTYYAYGRLYRPDTTDELTFGIRNVYVTTEWFTQGGFSVMKGISSAVTLQDQFHSTSGSTCYRKNVHMAAIRLNDEAWAGYADNALYTQLSAGATAVPAATRTFTVSTPQNYLIMGSCGIGTSSTGANYTPLVWLEHEFSSTTTVFGNMSFYERDNLAERATFSCIKRFYLAAGSHTVRIMFRRRTSGTAYAKSPCVIAVPLEGPGKRIYTGKSNVVETCTAADVPTMDNTIETFIDRGSDFIDVRVGNASNPGDTAIELYCAPDSGGVPGAWVSKGTNNTDYSWNVTSLTPGITYWFRARAYNWRGCPTAYCDVTTWSTLPPAIADFIDEDCTSTTITWAWSDLGTEDGYFIYDNDTDSAVITFIPQDSTYTIETGLSANTTYRRYIKAYSLGTLANYYAECQSMIESESNSVWTEACRLERNFTPGDYLVIATAQVRSTTTSTTTTYWANCALFQDDTEMIGNVRWYNRAYWHSFMATKIFTADGVSSYAFSLKLSGGTATETEIKNSAIIAIKLEDLNYDYNEDSTEKSSNSTTPQLHSTLTITPLETDDYLLVYSSDHRASSTAYETRSRTYIPGSTPMYIHEWMEPRNTTACRYNDAGCWPITGISSPIDIESYYYSESTSGTSYKKNVNMAALRLSDNVWTGYRCNSYIGQVARSSTTAFTLVEMNVNGLSAPTDYLVLATCKVGVSILNTSDTVDVYWEHGSSIKDRMNYDSLEDTKDRVTFAGMRRLTLGTGDNWLRIRFRCVSSGYTVYAANGSIIALPLEGDRLEYADKSNVVETCTAADVPTMDNTIYTFVDRGSLFIDVIVGNASNPGGTPIELFYAPDSGGVPGAWISKGLNSTDYRWNVAGLAEGSVYWFRARAQNWRGCWSDNCAVTTWETLPPVPTNFAFVDCSSTTLSWEWDDAGGEEGYQIYDNDTDTAVVLDIPKDATNTVETGLEVNKTYDRYIKGYSFAPLRYYYAENLPVVSTTSNTVWENVCTLNFMPPGAGEYLVIAAMQAKTPTSLGTYGELRLARDETNVINYAWEETDDYYHSFMSSEVLSASGSTYYKYQLQIRSEASGHITAGQNAAIIAILLPTANYASIDNLTLGSTTESIFVKHTGLTVSPVGASDDYWVTHASNFRYNSFTNYGYSRLYDGTNELTYSVRAAYNDLAEEWTQAGFSMLKGISSDVTLEAQYHPTAGVAGLEQNVHIAAVRLSDETWAGYADNALYTELNTTSSTGVPAATKTFTVTTSQNYLIMGSTSIGMDSTTSSSYWPIAWLEHEFSSVKTNLGEMRFRERDYVQERGSFAAMRLMYLAAGSHKVSVMFSRSASYTVRAKSPAVIAIPLEGGVRDYTAKSNVEEACTAAVVPIMQNSSTTFIDRGSTFIDILVDNSSNPGGTKIELFMAPDDSGGPGIWASLGNNTTDYTWNAPGLAQGATYWFKAHAFNWFDSWTDYCNVTCWTTLPPAITDFIDEDCTSTTIRWKWTDAGGEVGYVIYDNDTDLPVVPGIAQDSTYTIETGLEINETYRRYIKAYAGTSLQYYYAEQLGEITTTANTYWENVCTLNLSQPEVGDYLVIAAMQGKASVTGAAFGEFRLVRDETNEINYSMDETLNYFHSFISTEVLSATGSDDYKYQLQIQSSLPSTYITAAQNAAIIAILLPTSNYHTIENMTEDSVQSATYKNHSVITVTPVGASDDYLLVHCSDYRSSSAAGWYTGNRLLEVGGTTEFTWSLRDQYNSNLERFAEGGFSVLKGISSDVTLASQYRAHSASSICYNNRSHIAAFRLNDSVWTGYADNALYTEQNTTSQTGVAAATKTFTVTVPGNYLIMGSCSIGISTINLGYYPIAWLEHNCGSGTTVLGEMRFYEEDDINERGSFAAMRRLNLSAGSHTVRVMYRRSSTAYTVYARCPSVIAIPLEGIVAELTGKSNVVETCTAADVPIMFNSSVTFIDRGSNFIDVLVDNASNPGNTVIELFYAPDSSGVPGAWVSKGTNNTDYTWTNVTGLADGATYWFRARAANWRGCWTDYCDVTCWTTLPPAPTGFIDEDCTSTTITWAWDDAVGEIGYVIYDNDTDIAVIPGIAQDSTYTIETGLEINKTYRRYIKAFAGTSLVYYYAEEPGVISTMSSTVWENVCTLNLSQPQAGNYLIISNMQAKASTTFGAYAESRLVRDETNVLNYSMDETDDFYHSFISTEVLTANGSDDYKYQLQIKSSTGTIYTTAAQNAAIIAILLPTSNYASLDNLTEGSTTSASYINHSVLTVTPYSASDDYWVVNSSNYTLNTTSDTYHGFSRLYCPETADELTLSIRNHYNTAEWYVQGGFSTLKGISSDVTLAAQYHPTSGVTCNQKYVHAAAVRLNDYAWSGYSDNAVDTEFSTTSTTGETAVEKTFTVTTPQYYLIMGSCGVGYSTTGTTGYPTVWLEHECSSGTTTYDELIFYEKDNIAERVAFAAMKRLNLAAGSHTIRIMAKTTSVSYFTYASNPTVIAVPLEGIVAELTGKSNVVETCTAADVPTMDNTINTFTARGSYSIDVQVDNASNPADTLIELWYAPDSSGVPGAWTAYENSTTDYTYNVTSLNSGSTYWFKARAMNWRGCWTDYCDVTCWTTLPPPPPNFRDEDCTSTTITWAWDDTGTEDGYEVHDNNTNTMVAEAGQDATWTIETGLSPNTTYIRHCHAYISSGLLLENVFSDGFEGDADGWSLGTGWAHYDPDANARTGNGAIRYSGASGQGDAIITIDATDYDNCIITFYYKSHPANPPDGPGDNILVEYSLDGGGWNTLLSLGGAQVSYTLVNSGEITGSYSSIQVRFRCVCTMSDEGYWIDDVDIKGLTEDKLYTGPSNVVETTTAADVPIMYNSSVTFFNRGSNFIDVLVDNASNPGGTVIELFVADDSGGVPGSWVSKGTNNTDYTWTNVTGLADGATYWFTARAANWRGCWTDNCSVTCWSTLPPAPTGFIDEDCTSTTIRWKWDDAGGEIGYAIFDNDTDAAVIPDIAQDSTFTIETGLDVNTTYRRYIKAYAGMPLTHYYAEELSVISTTSNTIWENVCTLNLSQPEAGDYLVIATMQGKADTALGAYGEFRLVRDETNELNYAMEETDNFYHSFMSTEILTASGSDDYKYQLQIQSSLVSYTTAAQNAAIIAIKLSTSNYASLDNLTQGSTTSASYVKHSGLTVTPTVPGDDYWLIHSSNFRSLTATSLVCSRLFAVESSLNLMNSIRDPYNTAEWFSLGGFSVLKGISSDVTLEAQYYQNSGTSYEKYVHIAAIRLNDLEWTGYADNAFDTQLNTTSTTGEAAVEKTFTVTTPQYYLLMASCGVGYSITGTSGYPTVWLEHECSSGTTAYNELAVYEKDNTTERTTFAAMRRVYLAAGSHTIRIMAKTSSVSYTTYASNPSVIAIPLAGDVPEYSAKSNVVVTCTAADVPIMYNSSVTFFNTGPDYIDVLVDNANNPASTLIELYMAPDAGGGPGIWALLGNNTTDYIWNVTSLSQVTTYWFKARAMNWRGCWTDYCNVTTWCTVPLDPPNFRNTDCSTYTLTWGWDDVFGESGYDIFDNATDYVVVPDIPANEVTTVETGLEPNMTYARYIRAHLWYASYLVNCSVMSDTGYMGCSTSISYTTKISPEDMRVGYEESGDFLIYRSFARFDLGNVPAGYDVSGVKMCVNCVQATTNGLLDIVQVTSEPGAGTFATIWGEIDCGTVFVDDSDVHRTTGLKEFVFNSSSYSWVENCISQGWCAIGIRDASISGWGYFSKWDDPVEQRPRLEVTYRDQKRYSQKSNVVEVCTWAAIPFMDNSAATFTFTNENTITVQVGDNGNPGGTTFELFSAPDSGGVPGSWSSEGTLTSGYSWDITGLSANTTYWFKARATNWVGILTDYCGNTRWCTGPPAPSNFRNTDCSTYTLTWAWDSNGGDGFDIYDDVTDSITIMDIPSGVATTVETGLSPNVTYSRHIRAYRDSAGMSRVDNCSALYSCRAYTLPLYIKKETDGEFRAGRWADGSVMGGFVKFDVSGFPSGINVTNVRLYAYCFDPYTGINIDVRKMGIDIETAIVGELMDELINDSTVFLYNDSTLSHNFQYNTLDLYATEAALWVEEAINGGTGCCSLGTVDEDATAGWYVQFYGYMDTAEYQPYLEVTWNTSKIHSSPSNVVSVCTLAAIPTMDNTTVTFTWVSATSITANVGDNGNSDGTSMELFYAKGDETGPTEGFTSAGFKTVGYDWEVTGLDEGTTYWFTARAKNWVSILTDNCSLTTWSTLRPPTNFRCEDCSSTTLTWAWDPIPTHGYEIFDNDTDTVAVSDIASSATYTVETGLSPNVTYARNIKAFTGGSTIYYFADCQNVVSNYSITEWTNACVLEDTFLAGTYLVIASAQVRHSNSIYGDARCRLFFDNTTTINECYYDAGNYYHSFMSSKILSADGSTSHSFAIQIKEGDVTYAVESQNAAIIAIRLPTKNHDYGEDESLKSHIHEVPKLHTSMTITETVASDYLFVYSNTNYSENSASYQIRSRISIPGAGGVYSHSYRQMWSLAGSRYIHAGFWPIAGISSDIDVDQHFYTEFLDDYAAYYMKNVHMAAFRLSDSVWNGYACNTYVGEKSTTTSDTLVTSTFTPTTAQEYLLMASCQIGTSLGGGTEVVRAWCEVDGSAGDSMEYFPPQEYLDRATFTAMRRMYLDTSAHTFAIKYSLLAGVNPVYAANGSVIAIPLEGEGAKIHTNPSNVVEICTAAAIPSMDNTAATFSFANSNTITVNVGDNSNSGGTTIELEYAKGNADGPTESFTPMGPLTSGYVWNAIGLDTNTSYWFKARAQSWRGIWTDYCGVTVWSTMPGPPTLSCTDCTSNTLTWEWTASGGGGFDIFDNDTDTVVVADIPFDETGTVETGLSPNKTYNRYIKAYTAGSPTHFYQENLPYQESTASSPWEVCKLNILGAEHEAGNYLLIATLQGRSDAEFNKCARFSFRNSSKTFASSEMPTQNYFRSFMSSSVNALDGTSDYWFQLTAYGRPNGYLAGVMNAAIIAIKLPTANYNHVENLGYVESATTSWANHSVLTVTPPGPSDDYWIVHSSNYVNGQTSYDDTYSRLFALEAGKELTYSVGWSMESSQLAPNCGFSVLSGLSSDDVTLADQFHSDDTFTSNERDVHITAIRLNDAAWEGYGCNARYDEQETQSTSEATALEKTVTVTDTQDYLIMVSCSTGESSVSGYPTVWWEHDSTKYDEMVYDPGIANIVERGTFAAIRRLNLAAGDHTICIKYKTSDVSYKAYARCPAIVAIPLGVSSGKEYSDPSNVVETCTAAEIPGAFAGATNASGIDLTWDNGYQTAAPGNPSYTTYYLEYDADFDNDWVVGASSLYSGTNLDFTHTGVYSDTTHYYRIKARNLLDRDTEWVYLEYKMDPATTFYWRGTSNTDWSDNTNWMPRPKWTSPTMSVVGDADNFDRDVVIEADTDMPVLPDGVDLTINNLVINGGNSCTTGASGTITIAGDLTGGGTLIVVGATVDTDGEFDIGALTMTAGQLNIADDDPTITNAFDLAGGTVVYDRGGNQAIDTGGNYYNLELCGGGKKTAGDDLTVKGSLTVKE